MAHSAVTRVVTSHHTRALHVGINAHLLSSAASYRSAGVSNYSRHLLTALGQLAMKGATSHRFTAFLHADDFSAAGMDVQRGSPRLEQPMLRIAWEQSLLPIALARIQADVVHGLVNVLPLATLRSGRRAGVVTVHDLSFLRLPELFPPYKRAYLTALCRASVARAQQIVAVSQQTADDLVATWHVNSKRILVAPNGVHARFSPESATNSLQDRYEPGGVGPSNAVLPNRYWLYLGTLEPRKNLSLLIHAYARWRQQMLALDVPLDAANELPHLVLAGGKGWYYETIFAQVAELGLEQVVHFPGFIPDEALPAWYRGAELFLYPSRYEGFGLPVIEAMACGTPVLCSNAPGVSEVAADAAIQLSADDVDAWIDAMMLVTTQPQLLAELSAKGLAHAKQFTWEHAAAITIEAYERAAQGVARDR